MGDEKRSQDGMKLSILITTLPEQESIGYLQRLRSVLDPQIAPYPGQAEIFVNDAPRLMPTGQKRNELIKNSDGEYFSFIDDDDLVSGDYVSRLMQIIQSEQNPDVITFNGYMTTDGHNRANFVIRLGEKYEERDGIYYRYPNHLCAFKRSSVETVKFQPVWVQEDYLWATEIRDRALLQTEVHIDADLYHYDFRTRKQRKPHTGNEFISRANPTPVNKESNAARKRNIRRRFLR